MTLVLLLSLVFIGYQRNPFADLFIDKLQNGNDFYQEGKYQEAVEIYEEIIASRSDICSAHANLGNSYLLLKKYGDAINAHSKVTLQ